MFWRTWEKHIDIADLSCTRLQNHRVHIQARQIVFFEFLSGFQRVVGNRMPCSRHLFVTEIFPDGGWKKTHRKQGVTENSLYRIRGNCATDVLPVPSASRAGAIKAGWNNTIDAIGSTASSVWDVTTQIVGKSVDGVTTAVRRAARQLP